MQIDMYVREKDGKREIRFPILPAEFSFPDGDAIFITNEIVGRGSVSVPSGTELSTYSWESEFPGSLRKNDPMIRGQWQDPKNYINILRDWKSKGTELNLLITGYPVNVDVYCNEFVPKGAGAFGDIYYEISFVEARNFTIKTTKVDESQLPKRKSNRPGTYTIVGGDTLWTISEKFYVSGDKYILIYNANKEIIERTAKKHGFANSDNGHWIFPGTVIVLPDV